jgi:Mrp family chromosome partitioning ATPase
MSRIYDALENQKMGDMPHEVMPSTPVSIPRNGRTNGNEVGMEVVMSRLYQTITAALPDTLRRRVLFVGPRSREGTSTIARELAKTVSLQMGKDVLLVDCDGNRDGFDYPETDPALKLEEILATGSGIDRALCPVNGRSFSVLPLFRYTVPSEGQAVCLENARRFWDSLRERFELVVIDLPQAVFSNGPSIASLVDGVVIVVEAEKTRWQVALSMKETIIKSGGKVLGVVFNKRRLYIPQFIYNRL